MEVPEKSKSAIAGLRLPMEGWRLLIRERSLWPLAALPVLVSLLALGAALGWVVNWAPEIFDFATSWIPSLDADHWWEWVWVGPGRALLYGLGLVLFGAIAACAMVVAFLLASIVASPFHDALAGRVERLVTGNVVDTGADGVGGVVRDGLRASLEEMRRVAFFVAATLPLVLLGLFVPGAQLITGPALIAVTILFLPLDYVSYTLDRRRLSFAEKRSWLKLNRPVALGFGAAAFLVCMVPVLNFFAMPVLVVSGTLLAIRGQTSGASSS